MLDVVQQMQTPAIIKRKGSDDSLRCTRQSCLKDASRFSEQKTLLLIWSYSIVMGYIWKRQASACNFHMMAPILQTEHQAQRLRRKTWGLPNPVDVDCPTNHSLTNEWILEHPILYKGLGTISVGRPECMFEAAGLTWTIESIVHESWHTADI